MPGSGAATLRVFAFGRARVEKDGLPIDSPDRIQKSRELLYYLLSHPEGRTKEQIGLALWPEASTSQLRSSFHDTVFRLRRALGAKEWVLFEKRRYAFGSSLEYFYDVESFEENISAGRGFEKRHRIGRLGICREATELYRGEFLEDIAQSEWMLERQDELRRTYGESLLLLGELLGPGAPRGGGRCVPQGHLPRPIPGRSAPRLDAQPGGPWRTGRGAEALRRTGENAAGAAGIVALLRDDLALRVAPLRGVEATASAPLFAATLPRLDRRPNRTAARIHGVRIPEL